jgi:hypothetical protein
VPDELTLLREIETEAELPSHTEERLRQELLDRIAAGRRPRTRRWTLRAALVLAAVVVVAVAGALLQRGGEPSVAARAFAAITPTTGIMHFVAETPAEPGRETMYQEYWIDPVHPRRQRAILTIGHRVVGQGVWVAHHVLNGSTKWPGNPVTTIFQSPKVVRHREWFFDWAYFGGVRTVKNPAAVYRQLLRTGTVLSERETTFMGHDAYELDVQFRPPYDLVDSVWTGDRVKYVVDRDTYFPLQSTFQLDPTLGGGVSVTRYPVFEILPATAQNRKLLDPVRNPQPYRP